MSGPNGQSHYAIRRCFFDPHRAHIARPRATPTAEETPWLGVALSWRLLDVPTAATGDDDNFVAHALQRATRQRRLSIQHSLSLDTVWEPASAEVYLPVLHGLLSRSEDMRALVASKGAQTAFACDPLHLMRPDGSITSPAGKQQHRLR